MKLLVGFFALSALAGRSRAQIADPSSFLFSGKGDTCQLDPFQAPFCVTLPETSTASKVDVFLLFDDTGSFADFVGETQDLFIGLIPSLQEALPDADLAFGVGRFEDFDDGSDYIPSGDYYYTPDYYDSYGGGLTERDGDIFVRRKLQEGYYDDYYDYYDGPQLDQPFILNQPIVTNADASTAGTSMPFLISQALSRAAPGSGGDGPESAIEGLYQVATGLGYDKNGDGDMTADGSRLAGAITTQTTIDGYVGDVPPFSSLDPSVISSGSVGGAGWRADAQKIVILATDICSSGNFTDTIASPYGSVDGSVFSCRSNPPDAASVQETVDALVEKGIQVVGLYGRPGAQTFLNALAELTNSKDTSGDPLVYPISTTTLSSLGDAISQSIAEVTVVPIDIALQSNCTEVLDRVGFSSSPPVRPGIAPGDTACFDVNVTTEDDAAGGSCTIKFVNAESGLELAQVPFTFECEKDGGMRGDPHIKRWNQKSFDFHGEWRALSVASLPWHCVSEILLLRLTHTLFNTGKTITWEELPLSMDGFHITRAYHKNWSKRRVGEPKPVRRYVNIVLNDDSTIYLSRTMLENSLDLLSISIEGSPADFAKSYGLLGDYHTGDALGRDGRGMNGDWNAFGMEWQVQENEPKLFRDKHRVPQLPHAQCKMPDVAIDSEKVLALSKKFPRLYMDAQIACAKAGENLNDCMEDVLLAKDTKVAEAY